LKLSCFELFEELHLLDVEGLLRRFCCSQHSQSLASLTETEDGGLDHFLVLFLRVFYLLLSKDKIGLGECTLMLLSNFQKLAGECTGSPPAQKLTLRMKS